MHYTFPLIPAQSFYVLAKIALSEPQILPYFEVRYALWRLQANASVHPFARDIQQNGHILYSKQATQSVFSGPGVPAVERISRIKQRPQRFRVSATGVRICRRFSICFQTSAHVFSVPNHLPPPTQELIALTIDRRTVFSGSSITDSFTNSAALRLPLILRVCASRRRKSSLGWVFAKSSHRRMLLCSWVKPLQVTGQTRGLLYAKLYAP